MQRLFRRGCRKGNSWSVFTWCARRGANEGTAGLLQSWQGWSRSGQLRQDSGGVALDTWRITHGHGDGERRSQPCCAHFSVCSFNHNGKMEEERRRMSYTISRPWHTSAKWAFKEEIKLPHLRREMWSPQKSDVLSETTHCVTVPQCRNSTRSSCSKLSSPAVETPLNALLSVYIE